MKIIILYKRIKDSFKGHFLFLAYLTYIRRSSSLEKDTEADIILRTFDINSSNMFCSMHDFISKTLSLNL